ncbi:DUF975 family protein [Thorsellia kenyensis]|uniref:DUF975 family protein n=1 Tax=Thorsellia kenyensis TaxID=1549888 RepID=A0ABV6CAB6_9GAMM
MALAGSWKILILIGILSAIIADGIPQLIFKSILPEATIKILLDLTLLESLPHSEIEILSSNIQKPMLLFFVLSFLLSPFNTSFTWITLDNVRKKPIEQKHLIQNIKPYFSKLVFYNILYVIYITLWSSLLVIPGIIKLHSYALAPFILRDNPQITANQAITESRRLMHGRKLKLFSLVISFIGWFILAQIILAMGGNIIKPLLLQNLNLYLFLSALWSIFAYIVFWVYFKSALAIFYQNVINEIKPTDGLEQVKDNDKQPTNIII